MGWLLAARHALCRAVILFWPGSPARPAAPGQTHRMNRPFCFRLPRTTQLRWNFLAAYWRSLALVVGLGLTVPAQEVLAQTPATLPAESAPNGGPVRLRQPQQANNERLQTERAAETATPTAYKPGEFESYVQGLAMTATQGQSPVEIRRFGSELLTGAGSLLAAPDYSPIVPPDYVLQTGDELIVTLWGSVDADLRLQIDRSGRINLPRVGPIMVSGVRYADLAGVISQRVATVFKNFQLSVSLGQLRGVRVYVTGFVQRPGVQVVSSLSTLAQTVMRAGGPAAAGSYRNVQLRRGRDLVANFDLYDLLLHGDRSADRLVQADDVIYVGSVGPQVGLIGSVNRPAIFELKPGETVDDLLHMAGGFAAVADTTRLSIERLDQRPTVRVAQLDLPDGGKSPLRSGDVLRAFNAVSVALPVQRQNKRVRVEGEVSRPGEYVLPAQSTLADALREAGGLTSAAFLFGAEFSRESVRTTQQLNYERALRDLETDLARGTSSQRVTTADDAATQAASTQVAARLVDRLRAVRPSGRVVLQMPVEGGSLPELALEDGDRLYVPPRPTAVGVFGSVFNAGSYLYSPYRGISDYLRLAGGPTRGADERSTFVVRANGSVVSSLSTSGWLNRKGTLDGLTAEPGDTVFVPEEMNKTTFVQTAKDWTQILYQLGIGIAGIKSAVQ